MPELVKNEDGELVPVEVVTSFPVNTVNDGVIFGLVKEGGIITASDGRLFKPTADPLISDLLDENDGVSGGDEKEEGTDARQEQVEASDKSDDKPAARKSAAKK